MSFDSFVCRVCSLSDSKGYSLELKDTLQNEYTFLEMFNACTSLGAHEEDGLPQYICECCSNDLKTSYDFLVKAAASDQLFKGKVEEDKSVQWFYRSDEENSTQEKQSYNSEKGLQIDTQTIEETEDQKDPEVFVDTVEVFECEIIESKHEDRNQGFDKQFQQFIEVKLETEKDHDSYGEYTYASGAEEMPLDCDTDEDKNKLKKSSGFKLFRESETPAIKGSEFVQCNTCGKVLKQMSIKHHIKRCQKEEKLHLCSSCPKAFAVRSDLKNHMRIHDKERERNSVCPECNKGFYGKQALKVHMMRHKGVKEHQCKVCPKKFTTKKSLSVHEFTHNRELGKFVCKHCEKRFPSKADLTVHERFHTGDYPYQCEFCEKSYAVKSHYNYHLAKHKGITYRCDQCDKEFLNRGSLTAHKFKHSERMPHECPICMKGFASPFKLNRHQSCHKPKEENDQMD